MKKKTINKLITKISDVIQIACEECCLQGQPSYAVMSGYINIQTTCGVLTKRGEMAKITIDAKVGDKKWDQNIEIWSQINDISKLKKCTLYKLTDALMETKKNL